MIEDISRSEVDAMIGSNCDFLHHPANGRSGGILAMCKMDFAHFTGSMAMDQVLVGHLELPDHHRWLVAIVYRGKNYHYRQILWVQDSLGRTTNLETIRCGFDWIGC